MKISTVFFDMGKVLLHFDFSISMQKIAEKSPYNPEQIAAITSQDTTLTDYELGKISTPDFFAYLKNLLQYDGPQEDVQLYWSDIFTPLSEHIELARALSLNYPIAILSNTCEAHVQFVEKHYDFPHFFTKKIYSHEVGLMKPDEAIYRRATEIMNADPLECLFIDDLEPNILTPSQIGWQTIHLRPDVNLGDALRSYDLKGL